VLWIIVLLLLILAIAGGIAISKFLFILLIAAILFAIFAARD